MGTAQEIKDHFKFQAYGKEVVDVPTTEAERQEILMIIRKIKKQTKQMILHQAKKNRRIYDIQRENNIHH